MRQPTFKGPVVFDSEGLSRVIRRDAYLRGVVTAAYLGKTPVRVSAVTLVEVSHPRMDRAAFDWVVSRLVVVPVTKELARQASALLEGARRHGHREALDAIVCATALSLGGHPTVYTSDKPDITALIGRGASVIQLR